MTARQELLALAGRSAARVLDGVGRVSAGFEQRGLDLQSLDDWNDDLDRALRSLPSPAGCTRKAYLELVRPTDTSKRHLGWAPVTTARNGAIFRPRTTEAAHAIGRAGRSAATRIGDSTRSFVADRRAGRNGETSD